MAYTTPPTVVSGTTATAADFNALGDDIAYLYGVSQGTTFSSVQVTRSANQSIPDSTDTAISWSSEAYDVGSWWSSGDTITVPAGAIPSGSTSIGILILARGTFATNGTGKRRLRVFKNGGNIGGVDPAAISGDTTTVIMFEATTVEAADTIQIMAYQNSGGALNLTEAKVTVLRVGVAS